MAQDSQTPDAEYLATRARIEFAVRLIEENADLRFFCREFLNHCCVLHPTSVFTTDPALNAYNQGVQAAGTEFARMLTSVAPQLWPTIIHEEFINEPSQ